jgi:hypothetical protein
MGKKGKQRGLNKAEAERVRAAASRTSTGWVDPRFGPSASAAAGPARRMAAPKSELQRLREERGTVNLSHLRGLLRDRQREDTMEYQARRRQLTASLRVESSKKKAQPADGNEMTSKQRHEPGWVLHYSEGDAKERCAGPPTLQSLCVESLGPVITEYLYVYGVDVLSSLFNTLPSNVLAELSVKVSENVGVDDALVQALGSHNHVEALALHSAGPGRVTAAGILSIVPRVMTAGACAGNNNGDKEETWEDVDLTLQIRGCCRMKRLELCNVQIAGIVEEDEDEDTDYERAVKAEEELEDALLSLLRLCPRITHFSMAGSFRSYPHRLFQLIPTTLPSLQVLDLSRCMWMDDTILITFVRAIGLEGRDCSSLALVDVSSCPSTTDRGVSLANEIAYCMLGQKNVVHG